MSLQRADHSSRGVLPIVARRCVWSRNLGNEEAQAHWEAVAPNIHKKYIKYIKNAKTHKITCISIKKWAKFLVLPVVLLSIQILTFIYPCIASLSLKYNQQDAPFSRSIYFYKLLYMFQAVPPPIIRSSKLYIQRQVDEMERSSISSTVAAGNSIVLTIPDAVCTVLCSWWWAEDPPETCRAIYRNK